MRQVSRHHDDKVRGDRSGREQDRQIARHLAGFLAVKPPPTQTTARHLHQNRGSILAGAARGAAVAALAYLDRAGDKAWLGERHDVLVRGGDSRRELEDAFGHLEYTARRKSGSRADRVAETYVAALPREATLDQVQAIGERMATLYQEHGHLVGWAAHRPPDPHKGNIHLHLVATARPVERDRGAGTPFRVTARYRIWTKDAPPPLGTYKQFRQAVAEIINTVIHGADVTAGRLPDRPGMKRLPRWAYDALNRRPSDPFETVLEDTAPDPIRLRQARYVTHWNRAVIEGRDPQQDPGVIRIRSDMDRERLDRPQRSPKPRPSPSPPIVHPGGTNHQGPKPMQDAELRFLGDRLRRAGMDDETLALVLAAARNDEAARAVAFRLKRGQATIDETRQEALVALARPVAPAQRPVDAARPTADLSPIPEPQAPPRPKKPPYRGQEH